MNPIKLRYTNGLLGALHKAEISKMEVLDSRGTTSALPTFRSSTTLACHAFVALLVSLGICSLDWNHPDGPEISLSAVRHRASKPNERIGSLFINYGGPGCRGFRLC
jgi:hypothetical protein